MAERVHQDREGELPDTAIVVARIKAGEERALAILVRAYFERVTRFVYHLVGSYDAAQDVAQDVFVQLWEQRDTLEPERGDRGVKAYLFTLAKHRALNDVKYRQVRERYQTRMVEEARDDRSLGHAPSREDEILTTTMVQAALRALPERRQLAVRLRVEEQLSHAEIARVLELSTTAAERLVQRGLEDLRQILRDWGVSGFTPP